MDERHGKVSALLSEAAKTHHQVFRISDGADDDWATWYADWLVSLSEFPDVVGGPVVRSELTYVLVLLDRQQRDRDDGESWPDHYARELLRHFDGSQR